MAGRSATRAATEKTVDLNTSSGVARRSASTAASHGLFREPLAKMTQGLRSLKLLAEKAAILADWLEHVAPQKFAGASRTAEDDALQAVLSIAVPRGDGCVLPFAETIDRSDKPVKFDREKLMAALRRSAKLWDDVHGEVAAHCRLCCRVSSEMKRGNPVLLENRRRLTTLFNRLGWHVKLQLESGVLLGHAEEMLAEMRGPAEKIQSIYRAARC